MKRLSLLLAMLFAISTLVAQEEEQEFKPHGKPVVKVFANWHNGFDIKDNQDAEFTNESGFEITRAVIGYEYNFSPYISSKVIVDMDNPNAGKLTEVAYLRNAYVAYKKDGLQAYFGVIGLKQFKVQEANWGYRYLYKSAMDHYKFNNSVDAGAYIKYQFTDWVSTDITISNGEGAKSQQDEEGKYRIGYGIELKPLKDVTFRAYYDYYHAPEAVGTNEDQKGLSLFLGYTKEKYRLGVEYNKLVNYKFDASDDREIYSIYGSYVFNTKIQAFLRYDMLQADTAGKSEEVIIAGFEYKLVKGVKVSPNFHYGDYEFSSSLPTGKGAFFYLNFEYKF